MIFVFGPKQMLQDNPHGNAISSNSPSGSAGVLNLHEDSVDSPHSQVQDPGEDTMEPVSLSVDQLNLQHVSIVHHGLPNLGLPILLDRNSIAALISSSRDGSLMLDVSSLPRNFLSSQNQSQFLAIDTPMLSQKDLLASMIPSTSSSAPSTSAMDNTSFPLSHKQMLAQKYAQEMTSASLMSDQQLIESMSSRTSSPYVVPSGGNPLIDSNSMAVYDEHPSSLPSTSGSQCLPLDVYAIDRGVALVTSSRDSPESVTVSGFYYHL